MQLTATIFALFVVAIVTQVAAVDETSAKEAHCFRNLNSKSTSVDMGWMATVSQWYYPVMNRLNLYKVAADLTGKNFDEIFESSLYYDSCIMWTPAPNVAYRANGFNGKSHIYNTKKLVENNMRNFEVIPAGGKRNGHFGGAAYTTLTDNSTFIFNAFCQNDKEMTFGVVTTTPTVPKHTMDMIVDHAISLGFKEEFITELKYDNCRKSGNQRVPSGPAPQQTATTADAPRGIILPWIHRVLHG